MGYWHDSQSLWEYTVTVSPQFAHAHTDLGKVYAGQGNVARAVASFDRALVLSPRDSQVMLQKGVALQQDPAQLNAAIALYRRSLDINPQYAKAHNNLGGALRTRAQRDGSGRAGSSKAASASAASQTTRAALVDEAVFHYERAVTLAPQEALYVQSLASMLVVKGPGVPDRALDLFKMATLLDPFDVDVAFNYGNALHKVDTRRAEAVQQYKRVLRMMPGHANSLINMAVSLNKLGRSREAVAALEAAARIGAHGESPTVLYNLANALFKDKGQRARALAVFQQAKAVAPHYARMFPDLVQASTR